MSSTKGSMLARLHLQQLSKAVLAGSLAVAGGSAQAQTTTPKKPAPAPAPAPRPAPATRPAPAPTQTAPTRPVVSTTPTNRFPTATGPMQRPGTAFTPYTPATPGTVTRPVYTPNGANRYPGTVPATGSGASAPYGGAAGAGTTGGYRPMAPAAGTVSPYGGSTTRPGIAGGATTPYSPGAVRPGTGTAVPAGNTTATPAGTPASGYMGNRYPGTTPATGAGAYGTGAPNAGYRPGTPGSGTPATAGQPRPGYGAPSPVQPGVDANGNRVPGMRPGGGQPGTGYTGGGYPNTGIRNGGPAADFGHHGVVPPRPVESVQPSRFGPVRTVQYGHGMGFRESPVVGRPGYVRRTSVYGSRTSVAVYRSEQFHGQVYLRPVPAVIYRPAFYSWSFGAPVSFAWGWGSQPWYTAYPGAFQPYPSYTGIDSWMTDYVISQNMQQAYQAGLMAGNGGGPNGGVDPNGQPYPGGGQAYAGGQPDPNAAAYGPPPPPPAIPPDLKAQIAEEIRAELQDQQAAAASGMNAVAPVGDPAGGEVQPEALRPNHKLFHVVTAIRAQMSGGDCGLSPGDFITRVSGILDDGTVAVQVTASTSRDCPQGATTQIAFNDLNEMANAQAQVVAQGLQVAANNMGRNGLPSGPPPNPTVVQAAQAVPDSGVAQSLGNPLQ